MPISQVARYECDRCHKVEVTPSPADYGRPSNLDKSWQEVLLPTGDKAKDEKWLLCPECLGVRNELRAEHQGQLRAFVGGNRGRPVPDPMDVQEQLRQLAQQYSGGQVRLGTATNVWPGIGAITTDSTKGELDP